MKVFYTILFFADTVLLVVLSFFLLKEAYHGGYRSHLLLLVLSIGLCIGLLVYFLHRYMKLPLSQRRH